MRNIHLLLSMLLLSSCAIGTQSTSNPLAPARADMATLQLALGRPDAVETDKRGREIWIYDFDRTRGISVPLMSHVFDSEDGILQRRQRAFVFEKDGMATVEGPPKSHALRSPITITQVRALKSNLTSEQVAELLGSPFTKEDSGPYQRWIYNSYSKDFSLMLNLELWFKGGLLKFYPILPDNVVSETIHISVPRREGPEQLTLEIERPNKAPEPTITPVTDRAAHDPRQP